MNRLENIMATVVLLFIVIILFFAFYPQLVTIVSMINENVNATGGNYTVISGHNNKIPGIFGFVMVGFGIALLLSYVLNSHRKEYEEYEVYKNRYR